MGSVKSVNDFPLLNRVTLRRRLQQRSHNTLHGKFGNTEPSITLFDISRFTGIPFSVFHAFFRACRCRGTHRFSSELALDGCRHIELSNEDQLRLSQFFYLLDHGGLKWKKFRHQRRRSGIWRLIRVPESLTPVKKTFMHIDFNSGMPRIAWE